MTMPASDRDHSIGAIVKGSFLLAEVFRRCLPLLVVLAMAPEGAVAQAFSTGYQTQTWSHDEIDRLHGGLLRLSWNDRSMDFTMELGRAARVESGTTCGGRVVDPSACVVEPLDITSSTFTFSIGFAPINRDLLGGRIRIPVNLGLGILTFDKEGTETGTKLVDSTKVLEVGTGLGLWSPPIWSGHVRVFGEYRVFAGLGLRGDCEDCYAPLRGGTTRQAIGLGITIGG